MLLNLVKLKEKYDLRIEGVLHIGAHFGQENSVYNEIGVSKKIFFEPLPHTFDKLVENINGDGHCVNVALGNSVGVIEMFVESANEGQSSSILEPIKHKTQYPHIVFNDRVEVNMTTLDDYVKGHIGGLDGFLDDKTNYNFINIDVQGYELEVFKGGKKTLESIDYIMTEVNRDEVYKGCPMVEDLDEYLGTYNFKRVETTWDGGTWGDAFYIKTKI
jgi:FkbM family methyltransferase|tara:strand:+ start:1670 stop:2320 length:651 start_codon:yes stop_codon:yes gene_type:complete